MNLMDMLLIKIGPYEFRGEILVLIGIMMWILFASVCFSCMRFKFGIEEGFDLIKNVVENGASATATYPPIYTAPLSKNDLNIYPRTAVSPADNLSAYTAKSELISNSASASATTPSAGLIGQEYKPTPGYKAFQLPEGEMDIMATSTFKPECCPSVYSSSGGCACITDQQHKFFGERGGNNYPISEY
jgi:hypothetical protein